MRNIKEILGENIKRLRKNKQGRSKMTQSKLAEMVGIDLTSLQQIEYGNSWPKPATLEAIAKVFNLEPHELLKDKKKTTQSPLDALEVLNAHFRGLQAIKRRLDSTVPDTAFSSVYDQIRTLDEASLKALKQYLSALSFVQKKNKDAC